MGCGLLRLLEGAVGLPHFPLQPLPEHLVLPAGQTRLLVRGQPFWDHWPIGWVPASAEVLVAPGRLPACLPGLSPVLVESLGQGCPLEIGVRVLGCLLRPPRPPRRLHLGR